MRNPAKFNGTSNLNGGKKRKDKLTRNIEKEAGTSKNISDLEKVVMSFISFETLLKGA